MLIVMLSSELVMCDRLKCLVVIDVGCVVDFFLICGCLIIV